MNRKQADKAHKAMMAGLKWEHDAGVTTDSQYARLKKRAIELHKRDIEIMRKKG